MPEAPRRWSPSGTAGVRKVAAPACRGTAAERGYDHRWRKARLSFLADCPLCHVCAEKGLVVEATEVDHLIPHRGDPAKFWDRRLWRAKCKPCHSRKTVEETRGGANWSPRYGDVPPLPGGQEPF